MILCKNCHTYDDGEGIVCFCPLHEAAEEMLEALQGIIFAHELGFWRTTNSTDDAAITKLKKVTAKARGE